ncbi:MAG TPA: polysaccharide lyase family protein, partial [Bacilli bacterium]
MKKVFCILFAFVLILSSAAGYGLSGSDEVKAAGTELWRIGNVNAETSEFATSGSGALTYTVPSDWATKTSWTDFQGKWETSSGNNLSYTINYSLSSVPANAYFEMGVYDADNETSAYKVKVNGVELNVKWVGGRNKTGSGFDSVIHLYWPIPTNVLTTGANTLQIYSPLQNTGNSMVTGGDKGTVLLDYIRFINGSQNVYKP